MNESKRAGVRVRVRESEKERVAFLPHKNMMFCLDKIKLGVLKATLSCQNVREQAINCLKI